MNPKKIESTLLSLKLENRLKKKKKEEEKNERRNNNNEQQIV